MSEVYETVPDKAFSEARTESELLHVSRELSLISKSSATAVEHPKDTSVRISSFTINEINRAVTRAAPAVERENIMQERNDLVQKKFKGGGISEREERRLTYLRWQLDRFDDAEVGEALDRLETITETHEKFAKELTSFLDQIKIGLSGPNKSRKEKRR